jgi:hypothetical protein
MDDVMTDAFNNRIIYRNIVGCLCKKGGRDNRLPNGKNIFEIQDYISKKGLHININVLRKFLDIRFTDGNGKTGFISKIRRGRTILYYLEFRYRKVE